MKKKIKKISLKRERTEKGEKKVTFPCLLPQPSINISPTLTHFKTAKSERSLIGITQRTTGSLNSDNLQRREKTRRCVFG